MKCTQELTFSFGTIFGEADLIPSTTKETMKLTCVLLSTHYVSKIFTITDYLQNPETAVLCLLNELILVLLAGPEKKQRNKKKGH